MSNVSATDERGNGDWLPIEDLTVEAADVSLHLVAANNVKYADAVYDPLFSATRKASYGAYIPDDMVRALACTDQLQVCGHNSDHCTPLLGTSLLNHNLSSSYGFSGTRGYGYSYRASFPSGLELLCGYIESFIRLNC